MNAHTVSSRQTSQSGVEMCPAATKRPAVNSSESPGRKNPTRSPHSAKTIRHSPTSIHGPSIVSSFSGSSQSGPNAIVTATTVQVS